MRRRRRTARFGLHGMTVFLAVGCQLVTGAKERTLVPERPPCSSSSDCDGGVCLFEGCSVVCQLDVDCDSGWHCLQTSLGTACVRSDMGCEPSCPQGTECRDGQCRTSCDLVTRSCLNGYACVESVCIAHTSLEASVDATVDVRVVDVSTSETGAVNDGGMHDAPSGSCSVEDQEISPDPHDCMRFICHAGQITGTPENGETPDDLNPCTKDTCSNGRPVYTPLDGAICPGGTCVADKCLGPCTNGKKDGNETDVDCGGGTCPKCDDGKKCSQPSDCLLGAPCTTGVCGPDPIAIEAACFDVLLMRGGNVVEPESSPGDTVCNATGPTVRERAGDTVFFYVNDPPDNSGLMAGPFPPIYYFWRCVSELHTRADMLREFASAAPWTQSAELILQGQLPFAGRCPGPAVFKF